MIKTQNQGIQTAVCEVKTLSLPKRLRLRYEAHLKEIRDKKAIEAYIRDEGINEGIEQGISLTKDVLQLSSQGMSSREISEQLAIPLKRVLKILE